MKETRLDAHPGERVLAHLEWARELLAFDDAECRREFRREFGAYWRQLAHKKEPLPILSLIAPGGRSREIVYGYDRKRQRTMVADEKSELLHWMDHSNLPVSQKDVLTTWLDVLPRPWMPQDYPEFGRDLMIRIPQTALEKMLVPGRDCPVVFEVNTPTGPVFAAAWLQSASETELVKGFRSLSRIPFTRIVASFGGHHVRRCPVDRIDGRWIHGRDRDPTYSVLRTKRVVVVGCGSLGATVIRLLAQSGLGHFLLVDPDELSPANVARHALGMRFAHRNKAGATAHSLREDFPHILSVTSYPKRFEQLSDQELDGMADADLLISAGIDFEGDTRLDAWRRQLEKPPGHLCAWVEGYAIVGHAVLLYGTDSLSAGFEEDERPTFRLTDWPEQSAMAVEAGCGNRFQPHGAVDLQPTAAMAARLAIDALLDRVPASCRRVWQGERAAVAANGGVARSSFSESNVVRQRLWP